MLIMKCCEGGGGVGGKSPKKTVQKEHNIVYEHWQLLIDLFVYRWLKIYIYIKENCAGLCNHFIHIQTKERIIAPKKRVMSIMWYNTNQ